MLSRSSQVGYPQTAGTNGQQRESTGIYGNHRKCPTYRLPETEDGTIVKVSVPLTPLTHASINRGADQTVILIRELAGGTYHVLLETTNGFANVALLADATAPAAVAAAP